MVTGDGDQAVASGEHLEALRFVRAEFDDPLVPVTSGPRARPRRSA